MTHPIADPTARRTCDAILWSFLLLPLAALTLGIISAAATVYGFSTATEERTFAALAALAVLLPVLVFAVSHLTRSGSPEAPVTR